MRWTNKGERRMDLIIKKETLDKVMDCLVRSIHPNHIYLQINQLITELSKLDPVEKPVEKPVEDSTTFKE